MTDSEILKQINGGLKNAINAHGPITAQHIGSASKRILAQFTSLKKTKKLLSKEMSTRQLIEEKDSEIQRLKDIIGVKKKIIQDLLDKLEATGEFKRSGH